MSSLADERCPSCGKYLTREDYHYFECMECGHLMFGDETCDDLDGPGDDAIDWMEGYEED
jgi:predicted RNA-binding Zn-ribbon protein involved in translation (DUF1610 family)